jgi:hypothetical protein
MKIGHILNEDDLKIATPSVLNCKATFDCVVKNPPELKYCLYSWPS